MRYNYVENWNFYDNINNRVALITGGSSGIGFAIAQKFVESGCKVIIAGRDENKLQVCSERLGVESKYIVLDVSDFNDIRKKFQLPKKCFRIKSIFWSIVQE